MPAANLIQSVSRAIDILETVAESAGGLRLTEVARRVHLKPNTAHNLLKTLVARGYVEKIDGPAYRVGGAALGLAKAGSTQRLLEQAERVMREVRCAYPDAILTLAERIGGDIVVRLRMSPDRPGVLQRPQGVTFQPYASASGLALLAFLPDDEALQVRERYPFYEFGAHLWKTLDELRGFLVAVREAGYAVPPFPDQVAFPVASPVRDPNGNVFATFGASLGGGRGSEDTDRLVDAALQAANELSTALQQL